MRAIKSMVGEADGLTQSGGAPGAEVSFKGSPDILDEYEAARYLGLSVRTLQGWRSKRARGKGPVYSKRGRRVFYLKEDLVEWIRSGRVVQE